MILKNKKKLQFRLAYIKIVGAKERLKSSKGPSLQMLKCFVVLSATIYAHCVVVVCSSVLALRLKSSSGKVNSGENNIRASPALTSASL